MTREKGMIFFMDKRETTNSRRFLIICIALLILCALMFMRVVSLHSRQFGAMGDIVQIKRSDEQPRDNLQPNGVAE